MTKIQFTPRHTVTVTPVYDTYWKFAAKRQDMFHRRVAGMPGPWTDDPILSAHRFTNAYRASDRVSQYLIQNVIDKGYQSPEETLFRILLFKLFNRVETWEGLMAKMGLLVWANHDEFGLPVGKSYNYEAYDACLSAMMAKGSIYSAAYIMPSPPYGKVRKHQNHLKLIEYMILEDNLVDRIRKCQSLEDLFKVLRSYPSIGDFLAFQMAIDINYSPLTNFSEMDFVVAGPGAKNGIRKCFSDTGGLSEAGIIQAMADRAPLEFERLGLTFRDLWGRPLQLIDCQNLFCETDKYARIAHPEFNSGRTRIKQSFRANQAPLPQKYPTKWGLNPVPLVVPPIAKAPHSLEDFGL